MVIKWLLLVGCISIKENSDQLDLYVFTQWEVITFKQRLSLLSIAHATAHSGKSSNLTKQEQMLDRC